MILSPEMPEDHDLEDERFLEIYQEATDIYGLMHARYITTSKGINLQQMKVLPSCESISCKVGSATAPECTARSRMWCRLVCVKI
jgi:hypothetical protein